MHWQKTKRGLMALSLTMLAACSTKTEYLKPRILCPKADECQAYTPAIRTQGELAEAYLQTQHRLSACVLEKQALEQCIQTFNEEKP